MMKTMVESNIFTGYRVGMHPPTIISLLQFVDDTLLLGVKSWANVRLCTLFLLIFKKCRDLKFNFHKSMLDGININDS